MRNALKASFPSRRSPGSATHKCDRRLRFFIQKILVQDSDFLNKMSLILEFPDTTFVPGARWAGVFAEGRDHMPEEGTLLVGKKIMEG